MPSTPEWYSCYICDEHSAHLDMGSDMCIALVAAAALCDLMGHVTKRELGKRDL